jgi:CDP-diacylglycerol--serine O-phosphatidyltransferase
MNKSLIPNLMTAGNLLCGVLACVWVIQGQSEWVALAVLASLLLDFADGFVARLLGVSSEMGKQLDSLADVVSFGVSPALMVGSLLGFEGNLWPVAALIAVFSGWRLAKFNIDPRQGTVFYGVPTPANAMLMLSLWLIVQWEPRHWMAVWVQYPGVLLGLIAFSCVMMVADIPLIALKFKGFGWKGNEFRYALLAGSVILLLALQIVGIPFVFLWYLLLSVAEPLLTGKKTSQTPLS